MTQCKIETKVFTCPWRYKNVSLCNAFPFLLIKWKTLKWKNEMANIFHIIAIGNSYSYYFKWRENKNHETEFEPCFISLIHIVFCNINKPGFLHNAEKKKFPQFPGFPWFFTKFFLTFHKIFSDISRLGFWKKHIHT